MFSIDLLKAIRYIIPESMIKKSLLLTILTLLVFNVYGQKRQEISINNVATSENNKVRLSLIKINADYLNSYNSLLKEEIESSMALEPGVLVLYAVAEKEHPNHITILEIYADEEAYLSHLKTPHFQKYKESTLKMIQSLELIDTKPLIPGLKIK